MIHLADKRCYTRTVSLLLTTNRKVESVEGGMLMANKLLKVFVSIIIFLMIVSINAK